MGLVFVGRSLIARCSVDATTLGTYKLLYPKRPKIFEFESSGLSINTGKSGGEDHQIIYTNLSQNIASLKSLDVNVLTDNMSRN